MTTIPNSLPGQSDRLPRLHDEAFADMTRRNTVRIHQFLHASLAEYIPLRIDPNSDPDRTSPTAPTDDRTKAWLELELKALGAPEEPVFRTQRKKPDPVDVHIYEAMVPSTTSDPNPRDKVWLQVEEWQTKEGDDQYSWLSLKAFRHNPTAPKPKPKFEVVGPEPTPPNRYQRFARAAFGGIFAHQPRKNHLP